jgi:branched-chain amino acid aminotransferase
MEIAGQFFVKNKEIKERKEFNSEFLSKGINIYEVIRIIQGIPLFFEDHYLRFQRALQLSINKDEKIPSPTKVYENLISLIQHCNIQEGNIKIVYHASKEENFLIIYLVEYNYPHTTQYLNGVKAAIYQVERPNPSIKNWLSDYKKKAAIFKKEKAVYELILMRNDGIITEGSQSNIFFIKNETVYTAPEKLILPGITRKYVLEICLSQNIPLVEKEFDLNFVLQSDAVFLSGTSPKILPVSFIDKTAFKVDHIIIETLKSAYDEKIKYYLQK